MALQTIQEIIEIGYASTYLAGNYNAKGSIFSGGVMVPPSPLKILMVTQGLEWGYNGGAQTDASLRSTANYLLWLCGKFQLEAQNIINGPGGGSVVPVNPTNKPLPLDFEVSGSSIIAAGASSATISSFIGYNVDFSRGGIEQNTTDVGGSYFTWDRQTGIFTCSPAAQSGELFRITPV